MIRMEKSFRPIYFHIYFFTDEGSVSKSTKSYETIFDDGEDTNKVK